MTSPECIHLSNDLLDFLSDSWDSNSEAMNRFRVKEGTEDQFEQRWGKDRSIASCLTQRNFKKSAYSIVLSVKSVSNPHCLVT